MILDAFQLNSCEWGKSPIILGKVGNVVNRLLEKSNLVKLIGNEDKLFNWLFLQLNSFKKGNTGNVVKKLLSLIKDNPSKYWIPFKSDISKLLISILVAFTIPFVGFH